MKNKYFVLIRVSDWKKSQIAVNPDYKIVIFKEVETGKQHHTYIGVGFKNMANWSNVLNKVWGVYTGIKILDNNLIDGDSIPVLAEPLTETETKNFKLYGTIDKPQRPSDNNIFGNDLFSIGD